MHTWELGTLQQMIRAMEYFCLNFWSSFLANTIFLTAKWWLFRHWNRWNTNSCGNIFLWLPAKILVQCIILAFCLENPFSKHPKMLAKVLFEGLVWWWILTHWSSFPFSDIFNQTGSLYYDPLGILVFDSYTRHGFLHDIFLSHLKTTITPWPIGLKTHWHPASDSSEEVTSSVKKIGLYWSMTSRNTVPVTELT